jgi:hypothetical protein
LEQDAKKAEGSFGEKSVLWAVVRMCGDEIKSLREKLGMKKDLTGGKRLMESLKWPSKSGECQKSVDKLHRLVRTFEFALAVSNQ